MLTANSTARLRAAITDSKPILREAVAPDPHITRIASEWPERHSFLGRSTQAVYQRMSRFLATVARAHFDTAVANLRVLDWGTGMGQNAFLMRQAGFNVTAADISDERFGRDLPLLEGIELVELTDPVRLPFETGRFDIVASFGVLEHVPNDLASMHEIRRVLKPGGIFYVTFLPCPLSWTQAITKLRVNYEWRNYHDHFYSPRTLRRLADQSGFGVESVWYAQLFPKSSIPRRFDSFLEPIDRALCHTPLKYFATNLEAVLLAQ